MSKEVPFVSVVVICLNGEATLGAALSSLVKQRYPKDRYEIIVVDDGSTDNSSAIAATYPSVQCIRLDKNRGRPAARNAGLKVTKGSIYAAFDCDCTADPGWLSNIVTGYRDGKAIGVGALLVESKPAQRLTTRYISICDSLFAPLSTSGAGAARLPHQRLVNYITAHLYTPVINDDQLQEVGELYGATGSFPRDVLLAVGGWDESMNGIEDRDLCQRMRTAFPGRPFYLVPSAKIVHERGEHLWQYLLRPIKRGEVTFVFHQRNKIMPPVFPFPLVYIALCLLSIAVSPLAFLACIVCLPQLLYVWWPHKALQRRQAILLLFPYIQLMEEMMVIIGIASGYISQKRRRHAQSTHQISYPR